MGWMDIKLRIDGLDRYGDKKYMGWMDIKIITQMGWMDIEIRIDGLDGY